MSVKYGKFMMPQKIGLEKETASDTFGHFVAEPLERGFGHIIGNSMRRIMLTSLEAPAIIGMRLEGIPHEYTAIEGVIEDMVNIVLNLKGALLRCLQIGESSSARETYLLSKVLEVTQDQLNQGKGQYLVKLGQIIENGLFEILNPDLHLFTVTKPFKKRIELRVTLGRGYVPSERHVVLDRLIDEILVDGLFSPVRLVSYTVEKTRVGQDTDFDRLIMEVTTDGRVTPLDALSFASQIALKHYEVFKNVQKHQLVFEEEKEEADTERDEIMEKLCLRVDEIELSVRSMNCLSNANVETIAELVIIPERKMLAFKNFGKKSLNEIKKMLTDMGLYLGMDLSRYGITPDNVKEKIRRIQEERLAKKNSQQT